MDRPLKILNFLLWVFLLSQSHSLVESLPSDQPDRVSFLPKHHDKSTPQQHCPPKTRNHGSPQPPQEPPHPPSCHQHPPPPPPKERRSQDRQRQRKMNLGKKIGVMFLGIGVALQVVVVGVLGFKRWQISKKMKERQWDFTA
ncbi:hypothetical protein AAC387_Pa01g1398 [Persea americana]